CAKGLRVDPSHRLTPRSRAMTRPFRRFVPLVVLLLAGCISDDRTARDAKQLKKEEALTAEVAKRALLQMDRAEIYAAVLVPSPKDEPIEVLNADEIAVGIRECNLKEKTFSAETHYPNAPRHKHNKVRGVFQRAPDGKWVARVTKQSNG